MIRRPPSSTLFPSTTFSRSRYRSGNRCSSNVPSAARRYVSGLPDLQQTTVPTQESLALAGAGAARVAASTRSGAVKRSEEHTSELQSRQYLVCRLLLEKKK